MYNRQVMSPVLETAGSPSLEPYITGLYQHALAAMHIAFDALLIPGQDPLKQSAHQADSAYFVRQSYPAP